MKFNSLLFSLFCIILLSQLGFCDDHDVSNLDSIPSSETYISPGCENGCYDDWSSNSDSGEIMGPPTELFLNNLNENPQRQTDYLNNIGISISSENPTVAIKSIEEGILTMDVNGITTYVNLRDENMKGAEIRQNGVYLPSKKAIFTGQIDFTSNGDVMLKKDSNYNPLDKEEKSLGTISSSEVTLITTNKDNCEYTTTCLILNGKNLVVNRVAEENSIKIFLSNEKKENGKYLEITSDNIFQYNLADPEKMRLNIGRNTVNSKTGKFDFSLYTPNLEGNLNHYFISETNINQKEIVELLTISNKELKTKINSVSIVEILKNLGFKSTTLEDRKQLYKILFGKEPPKDSAKMNTELLDSIKNKENAQIENGEKYPLEVTEKKILPTGVGKQSELDTESISNKNILTPISAQKKVDSTITNLKNIPIGNSNAYEYIISSCNANNIDSKFCLAIVAQESTGVANAINKQKNSKGDTDSLGLFQIEKINADTECRLDPKCNIDVGVKMIADRMKKFQNKGSEQEEFVMISLNARADALNPSKDCPEKVKGQCDINPGGLIITRNHVKNIKTMKNLFP